MSIRYFKGDLATLPATTLSDLPYKVKAASGNKILWNESNESSRMPYAKLAFPNFLPRVMKVKGIRKH